MTDNKKLNEKRPADNPPGTFHYNPGNMAGKTPDGSRKAQAIQEQNAGKVDDQRKPDSSRRPK